jgi:hypothetical protein
MLRAPNSAAWKTRKRLRIFLKILNAIEANRTSSITSTGAHNETLSVAPMRVSNPDRSPVGFDR